MTSQTAADEPTVAVIPARGGSRRLPRKGVRPFRGRPMIAWTIEAARQSGVFGEVYVTTEDDEIATAAGEAGAELLERPAALAEDDVPLTAVLAHVLGQLGNRPAVACLAMPNCPLRDARDFRESYDAFRRGGGAALMSLTRYDWRRPEWAVRTGPDGVRPVNWTRPPGPLDRPERLYCPSGAIRWVTAARFLENPTFYPPDLRGFELPWHRAVDIDDAADLEFAECVAFASDRGFAFHDA